MGVSLMFFFLGHLKFSHFFTGFGFAHKNYATKIKVNILFFLRGTLGVNYNFETHTPLKTS